MRFYRSQDYIYATSFWDSDRLDEQKENETILKPRKMIQNGHKLCKNKKTYSLQIFQDLKIRFNADRMSSFVVVILRSKM